MIKKLSEIGIFNPSDDPDFLDYWELTAEDRREFAKRVWDFAKHYEELTFEDLLEEEDL